MDTHKGFPAPTPIVREKIGILLATAWNYLRDTMLSKLSLLMEDGLRFEVAFWKNLGWTSKELQECHADVFPLLWHLENRLTKSH